MSKDILVITEPGRAVVALHPTRIAILEKLSEPKSPASLAPELGIPRQHVNYHVRALEEAGFVELVEEKKKGNVVERFYRTTAKSLLIAPGALGEMRAQPSAVEDRESPDYLLAIGSRLIDDVAALKEGSKPASIALEGEIGFASETERSRFAWDLARMLSDLVAKYHKENGRKFRIATIAHPLSEPDIL